MKKRFFIVLLVCGFSALHAQQGYLVEYDQSAIVLPFTINGEKKIVKKINQVLVIGDTLALLYRTDVGEVKKKGVYGAKARHHAQFFTRKGDWTYSVVAWPKPNHPYIISDTVYRRDWELTGHKKSILGYECESAYTLNTNRDTIRAWFTHSIPVPLGPWSMHGLPGLILELEIPESNTVITAGKIETGDYLVGLPNVERFISREDYQKERNKPPKGR